MVASTPKRPLWWGMDSPHPLDLEAYLQRIGYPGPLDVRWETLRDLHRAHTTHIPFENLDVLLGKPPKLDLESLQAKLVTAGRGGYCFEQNGLFAAVLETLGFEVMRLSARVRFGTDRVLPRTHMVLKVEADRLSWLADVGFGGWGLIEPLVMVDGVESSQGDWRFGLVQEKDWWVLRSPQCPAGPDQYTFPIQPQLPIDYELGNHYSATHPDSRFVKTLTAQMPGPTVRRILKDRELLTAYPDRVETTVLNSEAELLATLAKHFGLHFPEGTSFPPTR